jgi:hypothetical protein
MSALAALGVLSLWLTAPFLNIWRHHFSVSPVFHIGLHANGDGRFVVFYSSKEFGPLFSVLTDVDHDGRHPGALVTRDVGWNRFGVYYRYIRNRRGFAGWTLAISLWYPFLLFSILPAVAVLRSCPRRRSSPQTPVTA